MNIFVVILLNHLGQIGAVTPYLDGDAAGRDFLAAREEGERVMLFMADGDGDNAMRLSPVASADQVHEVVLSARPPSELANVVRVALPQGIAP